MVAAAALADIVEEGCEVQQPGLVPSAGELRAEGVFVRMLGHEEAAHVAQHHEDVLVHGIDVEEVVLHLADDAPEGPEIAAQHRGLVHEPHGMGDAHGLLEDAQELLPVDGVAAEGGVHDAAGVVERAQRAHRQVLQAFFGFIEQEGFQDGVRVAVVEVVAGDLDEAGLVVEALVDGPQFVGGRRQPLLDVEQQDLAELRDGLGRPVIAAHETFARPQALPLPFGGGLVAIAEGFGHGGLQVEDEPVFVPAGDGMQVRADEEQQGFVALDLPHLEVGGEAVGGQLLPVAAQAAGAGHPEHGLQVAQAAGRLLAVGLQRVGRVLVFVVPLPHFQGLGDQEGLRVHLCVVALLEIPHQGGAADDAAGLQQRGLHGHVG